MEAKYVSMTEACKEFIWLQHLLRELNNNASNELAIKDIEHAPDNSKILYEDNQGAIQLAENPQHHNKTKHIDIKYHYI